MTTIDTIILLDAYEHQTFNTNYFDLQSHFEIYNTMSEHLYHIIKSCKPTLMVLSAYGSYHETEKNSTDLIFKKLPIKKVSAYSKEDIFYDILEKNVLIAGLSFYTCVRQRDLGVRSLMEFGANVYSTPAVVGCYGRPNIDHNAVKEKAHSVFDEDFVNDKEIEWTKDFEYYPGSYLYKAGRPNL